MKTILATFLLAFTTLAMASECTSAYNNARGEYLEASDINAKASEIYDGAFSTLGGEDQVNCRQYRKSLDLFTEAAAKLSACKQSLKKAIKECDGTNYQAALRSRDLCDSKLEGMNRLIETNEEAFKMACAYLSK